jgi:SAM-dependent methyltransferase
VERDSTREWRVTQQQPVEHFSGVAQAYAAFRPSYPAALFDWLAGVAPARGLAWDCGAGSGQATRDLARRFSRVIATDASRAQLGRGVAGNVCTWAARAEQCGVRSGRVELVAVAQALHWFHLSSFYDEVRRVLRSRGVLATWTYADPRLQGAAGRGLERFAEEMKPWWPPNRAWVDSGYRDVPFPFEELAPPPFAMAADWTLDAVVGYVGTWSAVGAYRKARAHDPLPELRAALAEHWGDPAAPRRLTWTMSVRAGRA